MNERIDYIVYPDGSKHLIFTDGDGKKRFLGVLYAGEHDLGVSKTGETLMILTGVADVNQSHLAAGESVIIDSARPIKVSAKVMVSYIRLLNAPVPNPYA